MFEVMDPSSREMERGSMTSPRSPPLHDRERDLSMGLPPHGMGHPGIHSPTSPSRSHPSQIHPGMYPGSRGSPIPLHLAFDKTVYSSPPQASNKPENNQCRLIDYRGAKVATFSVERRELICLPQAFDLFLKHLVGGLHTVYTKLKRLGITPVVCNVEQVRILRGLGAIQPGVNRCKLLAPKEFDVLYEDCTNSSARPGRPPKRASVVSPDVYDTLKKSRTEGDFYPHVAGRLVDPKKSGLFPNGYHFPPYHLPFMSPLAHPAMMNLAMANHLGMRPDIIHPRESLPADLSTHAARRNHEEKSDNLKAETPRDHVQQDPEKPLNLGISRRDDVRHEPPIQGYSPGERQSNMLHNGHYGMSRPMHRVNEDSEIDDDISDEDGTCRDTDDLEASAGSNDDYPFKKTLEAHAKNLGMAVQQTGPDVQGNSAIETLLMNILGLLKVAIENARLTEEQSKHEKGQLKMEMMKEKETRESMEKQLEEEQKHIALLTKKLKRERRTARRLQEQLESTCSLSRQQQHRPLSLAQPQTQVPPPHAQFSQPKIEHVQNDEDDLRQTQEDLKKLNELSNRMSPTSEERKPYSGTGDHDNKTTTSESNSSSDVHNAMESLIMSAQRLPSSCHGSANGYLHSPLIKQAEAV